MLKKQTKNFVSDVDETLAQLREKLPESESQRQEIEKHSKIAKQRDHIQTTEESIIWEDF